MKKIVAVFAMLVLLAACGGDDGGGGGGGGRPSTDEIATALKDADNPVGAGFAAGSTSDEALDCIAEALHDSELSDELLEALIDGDAEYEGSKADQDVLASGDLTQEFAKCATG